MGLQTASGQEVFRLGSEAGFELPPWGLPPSGAGFCRAEAPLPHDRSPSAWYGLRCEGGDQFARATRPWAPRWTRARTWHTALRSTRPRCDRMGDYVNSRLHSTVLQSRPHRVVRSMARGAAGSADPTPSGPATSQGEPRAAWRCQAGRPGGLRDARVLRSRMADVLRASRRRPHRDARGRNKGNAGTGYREGHCSGRDHRGLVK